MSEVSPICSGVSEETKTSVQQVQFSYALDTCLYTETYRADGSYTYSCGTIDVQVQSHPCRDVHGKKRGEYMLSSPSVVDKKNGASFSTIAQWMKAQEEDPLLELIESLIVRTISSAADPPWIFSSSSTDDVDDVYLTPHAKKMMDLNGVTVYDDDTCLGKFAPDLCATLQIVYWPNLLTQPIDLSYHRATATIVCFWSTHEQHHRLGNDVLHVWANIARKYERFGVRVVVVARDQVADVALHKYARKAVRQKKERAFYSHLNVFDNLKKLVLCADVPLCYDHEQLVHSGFKNATGLSSVNSHDVFMINHKGLIVWRCMYKNGKDPTMKFVKQLEFLLSNYTISNIKKNATCEYVNGTSKKEKEEENDEEEEENEKELPYGALSELEVNDY